MRTRTFFSLCAIAAALLACAKKQDPSQTKPAESETPTEAETSDPLLREMLDVVNNCKVNPEHSVISQCTDSEKRDLIRDFRRGNRDKLAALPTLAEALSSDDAKLQTVAARILEGAYRASIGDGKAGSVDEATATRLLQRLPKLGKRQANQVVAAVVHASVLAGKRDALFQTLDGLEDKALRSNAYSHVMVHGGAEELAKVADLANASEPGLVASALQAARNYKGEDAALRGKVCDLGQSKVGSEDAIVSMRAAQIMVKCGEQHVDALLNELARRDGEKSLTTGLVRSLYELCQTRKDRQHGTEAQCARVRTMLEKWIGNTELSSELRAAALFELGVQFADERSEKLCQRYQEDSDLRVKTAARESLRRIHRKLGKNVVKLGAPSPSGKPGVIPRRGPQPTSTPRSSAPPKPRTQPRTQPRTPPAATP